MTSGGNGFRIGRCIALGYVKGDAEPDTELAIEILGDPRPATLTAGAFYDPENLRLKA